MSRASPAASDPAPAGRVRTAPLPGEAPPVALYVHVPFCLSLCPYCDFVVVAGSAARGPGNRIGRYLEALAIEIELRADALDARWGPPGSPRRSTAGRPPLETVYLGGGTPSLLPASAVAGLLSRVRDRFGLIGDAEVTLEANPGGEDRGDLTAFAAAGVNRVSFGAQSLDAAELRRIGRRHRAEEVGEAVAAARSAGIASVNLDLLYDIPGAEPATWTTTLEGALALRPDHLSLYALTLDDPDAEGLTGPDGDHLPTTRGARRWRAAGRIDQDEDRAAAAYHHAVDRLRAGGWRGYEISNWARPGHESRHNLVYWERRSYEAVGPGAHAFDGAVRRWNAARLDRYVDALTPPDGSPPRLPPGGTETLDERTAAAEGLILALRTDRGVAVEATEPPLADATISDAFEWAATVDLVERVGDRVVLTTTGRLLSNELFSRLV